MHGGYQAYEVVRRFALAAAFEALEKAKLTLQLESYTLSQTTLSNDAIVRLLRQHSPGSDLSPMSKRLLNRTRWVPNKIMSEPPAPGLDCTTKVAVEAAKSLGEIGGDAAVAGVMSAAQAAEGRPGPQRRLKVLRGATAIRGRGGWTGPR